MREKEVGWGGPREPDTEKTTGAIDYRLDHHPPEHMDSDLYIGLKLQVDLPK